jgi:putative endonuclease
MYEWLGAGARSESLATLPAVTAAPAAFVYLLRCGDGTLYCGWTIDLPRRLEEHQTGRASRYTRARLPVELAWSRTMTSRSEAMREEARIKRLPKAAKLRLLQGPLSS